MGYYHILGVTRGATEEVKYVYRRLGRRRQAAFYSVDRRAVENIGRQSHNKYCYILEQERNMDPLKHLRSQLQQGVVRAWESLTEGWREVLSRSSGALTHFTALAKSKGEPESQQDFPHWALLAGETWETAQSVIIRVEVPGMNKNDLDISVQKNFLSIRGEKRSEGEHSGRLYHLMERAYGRFERTIPQPHDIDRERVEVSYQNGVITVILPKTDAIPPRHLTVP